MGIRFTTGQSQLGSVLVAATDKGICVVMSDGSIGGYSGLPGVKAALLSAEGVEFGAGG